MTVPVTNCNLKCSYCYIIQHGKRNSSASLFKYSPEQMGVAISKDRLGGIALINLCGKGETLIPKEMPEIIFQFLKQGHYINITTNGTLTNVIKKIMDMPAEYLERLIFNFSFHYSELIKRNLLDNFCESVKLVKEAGCSYCIKLNLSDEYIEKESEIKDFCRTKFGAFPVVAATRDERNGMSLFTKFTRDEYISHGKSYNSPLFDYSIKTFMDKKHEYCYAGAWTLWVDMENGLTKSCMSSEITQNIFDTSVPIKFKPIAYSCRAPFCVNANIYKTLGTVPDDSIPTFVELRDRSEAHWFNDRAKAFLSQRLYNNNDIYTGWKKYKSIIRSYYYNVIYWFSNKKYVQCIPKPIFRVIHNVHNKLRIK